MWLPPVSALELKLGPVEHLVLGLSVSISCTESNMDLCTKTHMYAASLILASSFSYTVSPAVHSHFQSLHPKNIVKSKSKPEFVLTLSG